MLLLKYCSVALDWTAWFDSATVKFDMCFSSSFTWQSYANRLLAQLPRSEESQTWIQTCNATTDISTVNHLTSSTDQHFLIAVKIGSGLIGASVVIMAIA